MGRADKLIKKLKDQMTDLENSNALFLTELRRTRQKLSDREHAFKRMEELVDTMAKQAGQVDPRVVQEYNQVQGQIRGLNRDLDACEAALLATKENALKIMGSIDHTEVNDLIKDKLAKEQAKGRPSQGLQKLHATWHKLLMQVNETVKMARDAHKKLNPTDVPALPPLPDFELSRYDY